MSIYNQIIQNSVKERLAQEERQKNLAKARQAELHALAAEADYMLDGRRNKKKAGV